MLAGKKSMTGDGRLLQACFCEFSTRAFRVLARYLAGSGTTISRQVVCQDDTPERGQEWAEGSGKSKRHDVC